MADVPEAATFANPKLRAAQMLWSENEYGGRRYPYLYCLLDTARDQRIHPKLRDLAAHEEVACLYQGPTAEELASVAPYIICLGVDPHVFDWIWEEGWGQSWGIFFWSPMSPRILREHFRRLTKVRTEDGRVLLFRFYDPRVLLTVLPTLDAAQVRSFFGPVSRYIVEVEGGEGLAEFTHADGTLREVHRRLHARF